MVADTVEWPLLMDATADFVYVRLHGPKRWYKHDYSGDELRVWADRIRASGAKRAFVYFNNDYNAHAPENAKALSRLLSAAKATRRAAAVI